MPTTTTEVQRIDQQLDRAYRGEAWHGPAVLEALDGVDAATAAARPIADAHSIWEITLHIGVWKDVVTRRLEGEMPDVTPAMDFPEVTDTSAVAWRKTLDQLEARHQALRSVLSRISDDQLDERPAPKASARYIQLHGVIQHDVYHAGQIAVLRKGVPARG